MREITNKLKALLDVTYTQKPLYAYIHSFGCMQNVSDGERIKGLLSTLGYCFTEDISLASLIIFNTCAVRESAETKIFGNIGELKHIKTANPNVIIAICGCMVQQEHIAEKIKKTYRFVDIVFGTHTIQKLPALIYDAMSERKRVFDISEYDDVQDEGSSGFVRDNKIKAYVPIMHGCNNFCTYCIVPYVRGRERSREPHVIIDEIRGLVSDGYKEIMLLGQNVNSYGRGLASEKDVTFSQLLRRINALDGSFKIRFMSSHPKDATFELIDTIVECEKVCKHLHLPVQSGSEKILHAMGRQYTPERYLSIVKYAREKINDFSFSTDIIVGFPGEEYADFLKTLDLIKEVKFDNVFTFIYSKRSGTKAAELTDSIQYQDKSNWLREMLAKQRDIASLANTRFVGKSIRVLADGKDKNEGFLTGRTDENIIVIFKAPKQHIGNYVYINIMSSTNYCIKGELDYECN